MAINNIYEHHIILWYHTISWGVIESSIRLVEGLIYKEKA